MKRFNESVARHAMKRSLNENAGNDYEIIDRVYGGDDASYYIVTPLMFEDEVEEVTDYVKKLDKSIEFVQDDSGNLNTYGIAFSFTKPYDPKKVGRKLSQITNKLIEYCDENEIEYDMEDHIYQVVSMDY